MHRLLTRLLPLLVVVAAVGAAAASASRGAIHLFRTSEFGSVLAAPNGHALYRFTADTKGHSTCTGACAKVWPPLLVKAGTKPAAGFGARASLLGTIKAAKAGWRQVTYAGFPLYTYSGDTRSEQVNGEGTGGRWFVVDTRGALVERRSSQPSTPPAGGGYGYPPGGGY